MSTSAAQAAAFYVEALREQAVWTVKDAGGYPAPQNPSGERAQPFWSLRSRAERVIANLPAYAGFVVEEVPLTAFRKRWLPGLERDGIRVGLNWSGPHATGYDLTGTDVERNLAAAQSAHLQFGASSLEKETPDARTARQPSPPETPLEGS